LENIEEARRTVGEGAPRVDTLRACFNHPGFIESVTDRIRDAWDKIPAERRSEVQLVFTAHSIPSAMAAGCAYEAQLNEACRLVAQSVGNANWRLVYQSRSGPANQPWLEPDIRDYLRELNTKTGARDVVVAPIGFVSDHIEVLFDLDTEAKRVCDELGINLVRAQTVGTHPRFITMIRELIDERIRESVERPALGSLGPCPDVCPADCCPAKHDRDQPAG
jgi:ferrochelatase